MLRKTGILLCCVAFFFLAGGHWAVLQSVAWARMIADYAQSEPLASAVEKTFDGEHPCTMCKDISQSKKSEERPVSAKSDKKVESVAGDSRDAMFVNAPDPIWSHGDPSLLPVSPEAPPVPPPRGISS